MYYNFSLDYKFGFNCIVLAREKLELAPLPQLALMADAAGSIGNGFNESDLESGVIGTCWFHCKKSADIKLLSVRDEDKKAKILTCLYQLQVCQTPEIFKVASSLFVNECLDDDDSSVVNFFVDFKAEWLDQHCTWYESYNHPNNAGSCSRNNGQESCNGVIKKQDTLRELLALSQFLLGISQNRI